MKNLFIAAITLVSSLGVAQAQEPNVLTNCEKTDGFVQLFDGTTLKSFQDNFTEYKKDQTSNTAPISSNWRLDATNKAISSGPSQPDIRGKILYTDFDLRIQYRNDANQGVFYRFNLSEFSAYESGIEVGIENDPDYAPNRSAGSVYDMFAPKKKNYRVYSTGLWNDLRIVVKGDSVEHWMNGELIISFKYHSDEWWRVFDASKFSGFKNFAMANGNRQGPVPPGYIGFQGNHGGKWLIRSLRINSTSTVKSGAIPASCTTDLSSVESKKASPARFTVERYKNTVALRLSGAKAETVSLLTIGGREVARGHVDSEGKVSNLSGWNQPGVYLVKATVAGQVVHSDRIFLQ
jgi:hypothetical protein